MASTYDPHNAIAYQQAKTGGYGIDPNYEANQKAKIQADWNALDPKTQELQMKLGESSTTHGLTPMAWNEMWMDRAKAGEQWANEQAANAQLTSALAEPGSLSIGGGIGGSLHKVASNIGEEELSKKLSGMWR